MFNLAPMLESRVYIERFKSYESVKDWEAENKELQKETRRTSFRVQTRVV